MMIRTGTLFMVNQKPALKKHIIHGKSNCLKSTTDSFNLKMLIQGEYTTSLDNSFLKKVHQYVKKCCANDIYISTGKHDRIKLFTSTLNVYTMQQFIYKYYIITLATFL